MKITIKQKGVSQMQIIKVVRLESDNPLDINFRKLLNECVIDCASFLSYNYRQTLLDFSDFDKSITAHGCLTAETICSTTIRDIERIMRANTKNGGAPQVVTNRLLRAIDILARVQSRFVEMRNLLTLEVQNANANNAG